MKYEWFIGLRYLKSKGKQSFVSIIGVISVGGVALGVATVILAISVMSGFEETVKEKFISNEGHIAVSAGGSFFAGYDDVIENIEEIPGVVATAPVIITQAIIQLKGGELSGVYIKAIDVEKEDLVTKISRFVGEEKISFDSPLVDEVREELQGEETIFGGIILGVNVAQRIGVTRGDVVIIMSKLVPIGGGSFMPILRNFVVVDIYNSGMYVFDNAFAFLPLDAAQELYRVPGKINRIEVRTENVDLAEEVKTKIQMVLGLGFYPRTWMEMHADLFDAMKLEKLVTFIIEGLIILVAAFNIASTLIMMVMEKTKDIGILKAMGATNRSIRLIFTIEGIVIGILGSIFGTLLGLLLCWLLENWIRIPMKLEVYQISHLPVKISWVFIAFVNVVALLICWIATLYPAWHASRLNPVEALRYE